MQVHALDFEDFDEEEYTLLGIHTALEDYKLAYLLNKELHLNLIKIKEGLTSESGNTTTSFSLFQYTNESHECEWFLIANSARKENSSEANELLLTTETKSYLIPEKKKVDYFLKITGHLAADLIQHTLYQVNQLDQIITAYTINKNTLKSKDFLTI